MGCYIAENYIDFLLEMFETNPSNTSSPNGAEQSRGRKLIKPRARIKVGTGPRGEAIYKKN